MATPRWMTPERKGIVTVPEWKPEKIDLVREVFRSGEKYLDGQLQLATSADQRAAVLGGVYTAAGTAVVGYLLAIFTSWQASLAILVGGLLAAVLFVAGAALCICTCLPAGFYLPGNEPEQWYGDVDNGRDLAEVLGEEAENYQSKIADNRATLQRNARLYKWGAIAGIAAPVLGFLVWFLMSVRLEPPIGA